MNIKIGEPPSAKCSVCGLLAPMQFTGNNDVCDTCRTLKEVFEAKEHTISRMDGTLDNSFPLGNCKICHEFTHTEALSDGVCINCRKQYYQTKIPIDVQEVKEDTGIKRYLDKLLLHLSNRSTDNSVPISLINEIYKELNISLPERKFKVQADCVGVWRFEMEVEAVDREDAVKKAKWDAKRFPTEIKIEYKNYDIREVK